MNDSLVMDERPLLTFVMLSYNQEDYVREAVKAALAQTYSPLEIIISDDASTDATVEIIRDVVSAYDGPHLVKVNLNPTNLGIGAHVNKVFGLGRGRLIVLAAAGDISLASRVEKIASRWVARERVPSAIFCGARKISAEGEPLGSAQTELKYGPRDLQHLVLFKHPTRKLAIGACGAYSPDVMEKFGSLAANLPIEDIPLLIRASMLGGIDYIDEDLVDYRINVSKWRSRKLQNDDFSKRLERRQFYTRARFQVAIQALRDTLATGNNEYISAATKGYLVHEFVWHTCERQRMSWRGYLAVGLASGHWRYTLASALVDGHPRLHRMLFWFKEVGLSFWRRVVHLCVGSATTVADLQKSSD